MQLIRCSLLDAAHSIFVCCQKGDAKLSAFLVKVTHVLVVALSDARVVCVTSTAVCVLCVMYTVV